MEFEQVANLRESINIFWLDKPGRQSQQSGSCCSIEAKTWVKDLIATQVASCKHVVLGCVFEVVFLVDKRWQGQDSFKPKRFGRSAETCTRSISGKGRLNTRILYIKLTYTRCRNILEFITITLGLS